MKEPVWLSRQLVEAIHVDQIREHGGRPGIRDAGMLDSALARARNRWEYSDEIDLATLAAEYGFGIARNHPFTDGNKRVAFSTVNVFLILNGFEIVALEPDVVGVIIRLADGRLTRPRFADWIRNHSVRTKD